MYQGITQNMIQDTSLYTAATSLGGDAFSMSKGKEMSQSWLH